MQATENHSIKAYGDCQLSASFYLKLSVFCLVINATPEARPKFSKIKLNNKKIQQKIVNVPGALDILKVDGGSW